MTPQRGLSHGTAEPAVDSLQVERHAMTLRQRACDNLRQAIVDNRFPPGTRLIERDLCAKLGVSRTSLREALRHLESEQLIEVVPHKGPVVATLTLEEVREIYEVRAALEGMACEKFASEASDADIAALRNAFNEIGRAAKENDHRKILEIKTAFYRIIFDGTKSGICRNLVNALTRRIEMLRRMSLATAGRNADMMHELQAIVAAARRRDGAAMKAACVAHVQAAKRAAIAHLSAPPADEESHPSV